MAESRYEKYVVRKPAVVKRDDYSDALVETDKIPNKSAVDTGPRVIFTPNFVDEANSIVEYGLITGDTIVGTVDDFEPHKHDYEEIFLFLGTNPEDTTELGAEIEFWIGEGEEREKVVLNTSSSIYIPPGVAHFPQIWKNVTRPVMVVVIMPNCRERVLDVVPLEGRTA